MRLIATIMMCLAAAAQADFIADEVNVQTASGRLSIEDSGDGFSQVLVLGPHRFGFGGEFQYINVIDQHGSLYLVELMSGGNACAAVYAWLHTEDPPRVTENLGNCAYQSEVLSDAETVTVIVPARLAADGRIAYIYDGKTVEEVVLGQVSANVGRDPMDWVGRGPFELLADADWRADFVALMGEDDYAGVGEIMAMSSGMETQGEWLVGAGSNPRVTGETRGVLALHLTDGRILVAVRESDGSIQGWGDLDREMPPMMERLIDGS
ncbi:hypothetical protein Q4555_14805 [Octadecabacter sp. 1_MG-2023]|uniref:hypothetical protein n=1 Tax=unclassified Octadecabacter TaxID=196158 RepID=UPI001C086037|nr:MULTISPECIES: hypothetical protein [unclassified Octadecabacter]MBU2991972.1 hypothetical protein [Octadecabacter sp. B2R22]MDO6735946.1 hypothetical protein [Octadecabacter sp. 1_MG-2023]